MSGRAVQPERLDEEARNVKVEMNQPVVMVEGYRGKQAQRGEVVKIGRVWIEIQPQGWGSGQTRRFRLDSQTDGSRIGTPPRFYTLDQWAEKQQREEALEFLRDQGVSVNFGSPWWGREVELAELLRTPLKPQEGQ